MPPDDAPSQPSSDTALLARIRRNDVQAFEQLIAAHYHFLLTYITHVVRSESTASDILHDIFLQVWNRRAMLELSGAFRPYLVGAASRRIADYRRTTARTTRRETAYGATIPTVDLSVAPGANPAADAERAELSDAVHAALDTLPDRAREVWILRRLKGLTVPEIATALGISENTVKTHMARGTSVLRGALKRFLAFAVIMVT